MTQMFSRLNIGRANGLGVARQAQEQRRAVEALLEEQNRQMDQVRALMNGNGESSSSGGSQRPFISAVISDLCIITQKIADLFFRLVGL